MIQGFDALGLAHSKYKLNTIVNAVPKWFAIGAFDHPFGNVAPKIKRLISYGYKTFRIQLWWDDNHKIAPLTHTEKQAKKWEKIAKGNPSCKFYLSHSCEYDESSKQKVIDRVKALKKYAPSCIPVDSVMKGAVSGLAIVEHHGDVKVKPGEIVSTDGTNHYDINAQAWLDNNKDALIAFVWGFRQNLREIPDPGQKVPKPKDRTASPSVEDNRSLVRLLEPKGVQNKDLIKPEFYKTHAEDDQEENPHEPDEKRENRPCLGVKVKAESAIIRAANGAIIGKLARFDPPMDGGIYRYYSGYKDGIGLYGYQIGNKAYAEAGSEIISIKVGKRVYLDINPAFREGFYK